MDNHILQHGLKINNFADLIKQLFEKTTEMAKDIAESKRVMDNKISL